MSESWHEAQRKTLEKNGAIEMCISVTSNEGFVVYSDAAEIELAELRAAKDTLDRLIESIEAQIPENRTNDAKYIFDWYWSGVGDGTFSVEIGDAVAYGKGRTAREALAAALDDFKQKQEASNGAK